MTCHPCHQCGYYLTVKPGVKKTEGQRCPNCGDGQSMVDLLIVRGARLSVCVAGLFGALLARGIFIANKADSTWIEGLMQIPSDLFKHPISYLFIAALLTFLFKSGVTSWFAEEVKKIGRPREEWPKPPANKAGETASTEIGTPAEAAVGSASLFLILMGLAYWVGWFTPLVFLPFVFGALGFALFAKLHWLFKGMARQAPTESTAPLPLKSIERATQARLVDMKERMVKLEALKQRLEAESANEMEISPGQLDHIAATMRRLQRRCAWTLRDIEYRRWSNGLLAITSDWERLSASDCEQRLTLLQTSKEQGRTMLETWHQEIGDAIIPEGQRLTEHLMEDVTGKCGQLKRGLFLRQAMLVVEGVDPLDSLLGGMSLDKVLEDQADDTAIAEFWAMYQALEAEFSRLQISEEIEMKLGLQYPDFDAAAMRQ